MYLGLFYNLRKSNKLLTHPSMQALNVTLQFVQIKNRFENRSKQSTFGLLSPNFYKHLSVFQLNPIKRETTLKNDVWFFFTGSRNPTWR